MINICEVGPRDGLQNEKKIVTTEQKVELIKRLIGSGVKKIEVASFVNPKIIPQMADAEEILKHLPKDEGISYAGLVLSRSGLDRALATSIDTLHVVTATSDTFNQKNANRTVDQSVQELTKVIEEGAKANRHVFGVLGTAFGCPFEGNISPSRLINISETFVKAGAKGITLADTTGLANPTQVNNLVTEFKSFFGKDIELALHFHNTRGLGLANVLSGYNAGVRSFDSSIAGLGGCPFAPRAVGNVCTEDMVNMFEQMGVNSNTDLRKLIETATWLQDIMERKLDGMLMKL